MKKVFSLLLFALLFVSLFSVNAFAYDITLDDAAELFSDDEIKTISKISEAFAFSSDFSVAVVTTDDAEGKTAQEYAEDYYDSLIFDSGWSENGFLILIDMDNRELYFSTAGECILTYSDSAVESVLDSGYEYIADGYYADCVVAMLERAENIYYNDDGGNYYIPDTDDFSYGDSEFSDSLVLFDGEWYEVTPDGEWVYAGEYDDYSSSGSQDSFNFGNVLIYIVIGLVIAAVTVFAVKSSYKNIGKGDEFNADDIVLDLSHSTDNIISRNVVTTRVPRNNNHNRPGGRSGGFGGGSSVHRSSGGVRHGGGGRKF